MYFEGGINLKKRHYSLIFLIFVIIISSSSISFSENLNVQRWIVEANLFKNGDLKISEDITFNFDNSFNGVSRNIVLEKIDSIENLSISEVTHGEAIPFEEVNQAKIGDKNKFTRKIKKKEVELKIFAPAIDEIKTFRIQYLLTNVAIKHSDTGEFYYKFLGKENKTPIDYFSINLYLPNFERDKISIFAHGPQQGRIYFSDDTIKTEIHDVDSNEFIENRILFPKEYISASNNLGDGDFNSIIEEERTLSEKKQKNLKEKAENKSLFFKISIYFSLFMSLLTLFTFYKLRRNKDIFENMISPYPDDITPAELSLFMNKVISPRAFLASLFNLSYKDYLEIEIVEDKNNHFTNEYIFTREKDTRENLSPAEAFLIDWIFNDIGQDNTLTTLDLEKYRTKNFKKFYTSQNKWNKLVKEDLKNRNYYSEKAKIFSALIIFSSLISFVIGIMSLIYESFYGLIPLLLGIFILIYGISLIYKTNDKGYIQYRLWKDFKNSFKKKKEKNINIDDDKALIYAIAMDLPMEDLDEFRTSVAHSYYPIGWGYLYFLMNTSGGSKFEDSFNNSFYGYSNSSTSSTKGSFGGGGGFTGGGGGGAGGGGVGGF